MDKCYPDFKVNKEHLPESICIDEFKSVKNIDSAMFFVFADFQSKSIIDVIEDRRLHSLTDSYRIFFKISFRSKKQCKIYLHGYVYSIYLFSHFYLS